MLYSFCIFRRLHRQKLLSPLAKESIFPCNFTVPNLESEYINTLFMLFSINILCESPYYFSLLVSISRFFKLFTCMHSHFSNMNLSSSTYCKCMGAKNSCLPAVSSVKLIFIYRYKVANFLCCTTMAVCVTVVELIE